MDIVKPEEIVNKIDTYLANPEVTGVHRMNFEDMKSRVLEIMDDPDFSLELELYQLNLIVDNEAKNLESEIRYFENDLANSVIDVSEAVCEDLDRGNIPEAIHTIDGVSAEFMAEINRREQAMLDTIEKLSGKVAELESRTIASMAKAEIKEGVGKLKATLVSTKDTVVGGFASIKDAVKTGFSFMKNKAIDLGKFIADKAKDVYKNIETYDDISAFIAEDKNDAEMIFEDSFTDMLEGVFDKNVGELTFKQNIENLKSLKELASNRITELRKDKEDGFTNSFFGKTMQKRADKQIEKLERYIDRNIEKQEFYQSVIDHTESAKDSIHKFVKHDVVMAINHGVSTISRGLTSLADKCEEYAKNHSERVHEMSDMDKAVEAEKAKMEKEDMEYAEKHPDLNTSAENVDRD